MRISESALRRIIREEIMLEQSADVFSIMREPAMKSLDATGQMKYIAARTLGGAVPAGAAAIAQGKVTVTPTVQQALSTAWNSSIMDWTLTSLGAIADFIPAVGVPISIGIAKIQMIKAAAKGDWIGTALAFLATIPGVGDALSIIGHAVKQGAPVAKPVVQGLLKALRNVTDAELIAGIRKIAPEIGAAAEGSIAQTYDKFKGDLETSIT